MEKRILLIDILLDLGFPATDELIIKPLYVENEEKNSKNMAKNSIFDILEYRLNEKEIQDIFLKHYNEFFESSISEKMQILSAVINLTPDIKSELIEKYGTLLSYFKQIPQENQKWADEVLSIIIENRKEKEFLEKMKARFHQEQLILKESGSYSIVLGTKEWILKICKERITWDCPRDSFLLNPSEFEQILDDNGIPIVGIEWQEYLPVVNKKITKKLIHKYLVEFRNQNLTIADSTILAYNTQNFRFLKDTAKLKKRYPEIPKWFEENPIVSIDIDAIYTRGENEEADMAMDEAISNFKK